MTELPHAGLQALRLGLDDWVPLRAVMDLLKQQQPEDQHGALLATVRALLEDGLALLGDLTVAGPFEPWSGPTNEQLSRLERE